MRGGSVCERVFGRVSNFFILVRGRVVLYAYVGFICVLSLVLSGCEPVVPEGYEAVTLPISIGLPVGEVYSPQTAPERCPSEEGTMARAFGDPGTTEQFAIPQYIYFFIVKQNDDDTWEVWATDTRSVDEEAGATEAAKREAWEARWIKTHYSGVYATSGDSIYRFDEEMHILLPSLRFDGRVYAVASAVPLTFTPTIESIAASIGTGSPTSLDDLLNMTFSFKDEGTDEQKAAAALVKNNLQNIYSSPYNYNYNGVYYGSFSKDTKVPHINLLLYHVAAKVDLMWNVQEDMRIKANPAEAVRLTYLGAQHLLDGQAYCFKPMRNELATINSAGYAITDIVTTSDEGLWWEGRDYFYTIPYVVTGGKVDGKSYFPLQILMRTNGSAGDGYQLTLNMQIDTSAVFVPWLRANFNLTQPLGNTSETKTVDY